MEPHRVQLHSSHHDYGPVIKRVPGTCLKNLQSEHRPSVLACLTSHNPKHHCGLTQRDAPPPNPSRKKCPTAGQAELHTFSLIKNLERLVRSIWVSDATLFWICWHGRSWRQEAKLSHHADIVTSRVVVHDLSVPEL